MVKQLLGFVSKLFFVIGFVLSERAIRRLKSGVSIDHEEIDDEDFEKLKKELHFKSTLILALVLLILSIILYIVACFL